jgi:hypothetical protein
MSLLADRGMKSFHRVLTPPLPFLVGAAKAGSLHRRAIQPNLINHINDWQRLFADLNFPYKRNAELK